MTLAILIHGSPDFTGLSIWCALGFCGGIAISVYGFRMLQRRRLILDTPFSKIRSASLGMVEISGLAVGPYTMIAPITTRPCYYHRTLVWEWKQHGKNKEWVKVAGECMHVPFFVDDNTGRLLVDPRGADLDLHRDFQEEFCDSFFTTKQPVPDNIRTFLARHGISTTNKIKVEEFCIKPKNSLFILGTLAENPGLKLSPNPICDQEGTSFSLNGFTLSITSASSNTNDNLQSTKPGSLLDRLTKSAGTSPRYLIRLSSESTPSRTEQMSQQEKIASALTKAGISNPAAWAAAGVPVSVQNAPTPQLLADAAIHSDIKEPRPAESSNTSSFDFHPAVVLMKGSSANVFLISWRSQKDIARSLGWKCTLMIWGGPVLALFSLYVLLGIKNVF